MRAKAATGFAKGIGRSAVVAIALLSGLSVGSTAAAADQVASGPWSASYDGGSASGTASYDKEDFLGGELNVEGTLQVTDSDCYFVRVVVTHDLVPVFYNVGERCGQGTKSIDETIAVTSNVWSASVAICRKGGDCGESRHISV